MFSLQNRTRIIALGLALFFTAGLIRLFSLRFEAGDVYPVYSSLRCDPLGTRVLFESLNRLAENSAARNFMPPDQITLTDQTTLLVCGLRDRGGFLEDKKVKVLMDQVASKGGRLILTFSSVLRKPHGDLDEKEDAMGDDSTESHDPPETFVDESSEKDSNGWRGNGSLGFSLIHGKEKDMADFALRVGPDNEGLPAKIPWCTTLYLNIEDAAWQTLYSWQDKPVVLQRQWGRGSIVVSTDSYLFSNEALRNHRLAGWLICLIGSGHRVIFDEFHHGLTHQPGIATLARQYRLQGVFGALLVLAVLFIWRQTAIFVPPVDMGRESSQPVAGGLDTVQGLVDLVCLHLAPGKLLNVCFEAWKPSGSKGMSEEQVARVQALVHRSADPLNQDDLVTVYRQICELVKEGKRQ